MDKNMKAFIPIFGIIILFLTGCSSPIQTQQDLVQDLSPEFQTWYSSLPNAPVTKYEQITQKISELNKSIDEKKKARSIREKESPSPSRTVGIAMLTEEIDELLQCVTTLNQLSNSLTDRQ
jgi:hypothetical protein